MIGDFGGEFKVLILVALKSTVIFIDGLCRLRITSMIKKNASPANPRSQRRLRVCKMNQILCSNWLC